MFEIFRRKTKIADVTNGKICTIQGEVEPPTPRLHFPLSKTECVYYSVIEERFGKGARGTGRPLWFPDNMESKCSEFFVADGRRRIRIRESGERVALKGAHQESGQVRKNKRRRYFASLLKPGDKVIIRGLVNADPAEKEAFLSAPRNGLLKIRIVRKIAR